MNNDISEFDDVEVPVSELTLSDFSVDDVKEEPRVADGVYKGCIVETVLTEGYIRWKVSLNGNEGLLCTDDVTTVDGSQIDYRTWLPIKGDEKQKSKFGSLSEAQVKINKIVKFIKSLALKVGGRKVRGLADLVEGVNNKAWIGLPVIVAVKNVAGKKENAGKIYTNIVSMEKGS